MDNENNHELDELSRNEEHKPETRKAFIKGTLCGALIVCCIVFLYGAFSGSIRFGQSKTSASKLSDLGDEYQDKLELLMKYIDSYYLYADDVDKDEVIENIYKGAIEGIGDVYTTYYTPEESAAFEEDTSGKYKGIGAVVTKSLTTGEVYISKVFEDTPAEEAGLQSEDRIIGVDDHEITDEDLTTIVSWIKGEEGTDVILHIMRDGEEMDITATRREVSTPTVTYEMKEDNIGYIYVSEFDDVTYDQFEEALNSLEDQGMEGLVIDLRYNPGGNLDVVCNMLRLLLPKTTIVSIVDRDGETRNFDCDGEHEFTKPLVVLVNGDSASASEIFSGAVQDTGVGTIMGTTTYGKGVVQSVYQLKDGSIIKITTEEYHLPSGRSINGTGVTPDVEVELDTSEENTEDNQLNSAIEYIKDELSE